MKVVITGGHGFLGWHLACRVRALCGVDPVRLGRAEVGDTDVLAQALAEADVIFHVAGVNRATSDDEVVEGNSQAAGAVAEAIRARSKPVRLVYANSTQSQLDNPYGRGKAAAATILQRAVRENGGSMADVVLPNLFGEHGLPHYNSFVATFCHLVASGGEPQVSSDREIPLLHVQRAAQVLIEAIEGGVDETVAPAGRPTLISDVLARIQRCATTYSRNDLPQLTDAFDVDLFNTYRSYVFPDSFPRYAEVHADGRGELFETSRSHGGTSQTFVSTTRPDQTRGDHYHLHKIERFFVVSGHAEIALRRLLGTEIVRFTVSGERPGFVDMPTLWTHNITNVGDSDLVTMFWSDQLLDPERPDQFGERVELEVPA